MNKNDKVEAGAILSVITSETADEWIEVTVEVNGQKAVVGVKKSLSVGDYINFIEETTSICFAPGENGKLVYKPYMQDIAFKCGTLAYCTNIDMSGISDEKNVSDLEYLKQINNLLCCDELFVAIEGVVGSSYLCALRRDFIKTINCRWRSSMRENSLSAILSSLTNAINAFADTIKGVESDEFFKYLEASVPGFKEDLEEQLRKDAKSGNK